MIILAFDQASRTSGWSVFNDKELTDHGTFTFTNANLGDRLHRIRNMIISLIEKYNPDKIVFEDIQLQQGHINNVDTFKILAEVYGIISELATGLKIDNEPCLAGTWRRSLGIAGRKRDEQKENAQRWVFDTYGIHVKEDEADAICIGAYAAGIRCAKQKPQEALGFDWS